MSLVVMHCPVCDENGFLASAEMYDDRYGEPNPYQLSHCITCGHLATIPRLRESDLSELYGTYYPRKSIRAEDVARDAARVKSLVAWLERWWNGTDNQGQYSVRAGEIMLDVGCGSGTSLLEASHMGAIAFGIEADPNVSPIASALGVSVHIGSLHDRPFPEHFFDLIVLNQVIEHLPDPDRAMRALVERLKENGRIVLVFPNASSLWRRIFGKRWINWHIPYHLHHFNLKSFKRMAQHCGLEIVRTRTITPNVWTVLQLRAASFQPRPGQPSPVWAMTRSTGVSSAGQRQKFFPLRALVRVTVLSLLSIMNRIVDALGVGDSLLVEVRRSRK